MTASCPAGVRHGLMVVGPTGVVQQCTTLQTLTMLKNDKIEGIKYEKWTSTMNPKSSMGQLYG